MYLQLDTKFNPFTYDEMVKPLLYYKQAYDEADTAYSDLVAQTEEWKDIANRENSPEAFEMYQRYSNDLSRAVDDFSQGMNARTRKTLLGLKRRYAQDITPIAKASEAMNAANELRVKAGPDAIFEVSEYNSLDQFLHGKKANNKYQSREALTKKTAAITEAAMASALKDPEFKKAMGDQFWMITQHTGGSYEDLTEAMKLGMMDNPIAQNRFSQIRQEVAKNAGIHDYDAAGQRAIMEAIDTGLYAGLDKPVRSFQANADHITPAQRHSMAMQSAQLALSAASSGMVKDAKGNWVYDPSKDPALWRASAKSSSNSPADKAARLGVTKDPVFFDIKNPNKDSWGENSYSGSGRVIDYKSLGEKDTYGLNSIVQSKTKESGGYNTLKEVIDAKLKTLYPNADDATLEYIANNYYTIQVEDNGNLWMTPKTVITGVGGGTSSGIDASSALPAEYQQNE